MKNTAPTSRDAGHDTLPWPPIRNVLELFLRAHKPYTVYGHAEMDVTLLLQRLDALKQQHGIALSLNTYLVYALSRIVAQHAALRSYKYGQHSIVFHHADISVPILKTLPSGVKVPVLYIVRMADTKSLYELHCELRSAIDGSLAGDSNVKFRRGLTRMPRFVQRLVYRHIFRHPLRANRYFGNVGLTNLHHLGYDSPMTGYPPNVYTAQFSVGNVSEGFRPDAAKQPVLRKLLTIGAGFDHLIMDGMAIAAISKDWAGFLAAADGIEAVAADAAAHEAASDKAASDKATSDKATSAEAARASV